MQRGANGSDTCGFAGRDGAYAGGGKPRKVGRRNAPASNTWGIDQQHRLPVEQAETYFVDSTSTVTEYGAKL